MALSSENIILPQVGNGDIDRPNRTPDLSTPDEKFETPAPVEKEEQCPSGPPGSPSGRGPPSPEFLAKKGMQSLCRNGFILFCVLWATGCWIYGSNNGAGNRVNNLKVLVRDFDGAAFGAALLSAVNQVNGRNTYPTFELSTTATKSEMKQQVYNGQYWASISANQGVTSTFQSIVNSSSTSTYNASKVYTLHVASARYFTSYQGYLYPALLDIMAASQEIATNYSVTLAIGSPYLTTSQIGVVASPVNYELVDIAPLTFQARVLLNTFGIVISHLSQFFFNMVLNGIFLGVGIYRNTTLLKLLKRKYPIKIIWTLASSITVASFPVIFKESYTIDARTFFGLWTIEWVYTWINFNTIGTVLAFLPIPFVPMVVFPWVVTSITACLLPIELSNVFYRISYIFPSHVITIWGKGVDNYLYIYLPILAAWLVITETAWLFGDLNIAKRSTKPPAARH